MSNQTPDPNTRVTIVEDHPLLRAGLAGELERSGLGVNQIDVDEIARFNQVDALRKVLEPSANSIVIDLGLPFEHGGMGLITPLVTCGRRVAVLTAETDRLVLSSCVAAGASVVLSKTEPMETIVDAINRICSGETVRPNEKAEMYAEYKRLSAEHQARRADFDTLSDREKMVLGGLMKGLGAKELADRDFVSVHTVRSQVKTVLKKLEVRSQLEAVARAHAARWTPPEASQSETSPPPPTTNTLT